MADIIAGVVVLVICLIGGWYGSRLYAPSPKQSKQAPSAPQTLQAAAHSLFDGHTQHVQDAISCQNLSSKASDSRS